MTLTSCHFSTLVLILTHTVVCPLTDPDMGGTQSYSLIYKHTHTPNAFVNKEGCIKGLGTKRSGFFTRKNNTEHLYWTLNLPVLIFLPREQATCSHLFPLSSLCYLHFPSPKFYGRINYHVFTRSQVPVVKFSSFAPSKVFSKNKNKRKSGGNHEDHLIELQI